MVWFSFIERAKEEKRDTAQRPENPGSQREPQQKTKVEVLHICLAVTPLAPTLCYLQQHWSPSGMHKYVLLLARQVEILLSAAGLKGRVFDSKGRRTAVTSHSQAQCFCADGAHALILCSDAGESLHIVVVALPNEPFNRIVQRSRMAGLGIFGNCLGVSDMQPSSGSHKSMFDLFPVFLGRPPQLDVRGCESEGRSPSSLSSHGRRGAESGGPLKIEWHCFVSVSGFLAWPGWWNKEGFMWRQKPSVLSNEEQLRGLETAPRQRGQRAAEDRAAGLP